MLIQLNSWWCRWEEEEDVEIHACADKDVQWFGGCHAAVDHAMDADAVTKGIKIHNQPPNQQQRRRRRQRKFIVYYRHLKGCIKFKYSVCMQILMRNLYFILKKRTTTPLTTTTRNCDRKYQQMLFYTSKRVWSKKSSSD